MADKSTDPVPDKSPRSTFQRVLIAVGVGLAALGIAYGVGRFQTSGLISDAEQRAQKAEDSAAEVTNQLRNQAQFERQRATRLEARRHMHLALMELDERNFGTAEQHLHTAGNLLSSEGTKEKLGELSALLSATKLAAAEDVSNHRTKIMGAIATFDRTFPPEKP